MSGNADNIHIPGPEEDALISVGIAEDADPFELDSQWFEEAMMSSEAIPHVLGRLRRPRGKQKTPIKRQLHIRLDADIVDWSKNTGPDERGYQTRIDQALREHVTGTATRPPNRSSPLRLPPY